MDIENEKTHSKNQVSHSYTNYFQSDLFCGVSWDEGPEETPWSTSLTLKGNRQQITEEKREARRASVSFLVLAFCYGDAVKSTCMEKLHNIKNSSRVI
jgi:hypothetical protein